MKGVISVLSLLAVFLGALAADSKQAEKAPSAKKPAANKDPKNLVSNGDFETGKTTPDGWQTIDGLTTFWVKDDDPKHGKVLKFDTDVLQTQGYEWWEKISKGAAPKDAPKKAATVEPKYDTLGGNDGVFMWSDPIQIKKGKAYWLTLDVKGPGLMVWLVGYPEKPSTTYGADMAAFQGYLKEKVLPKADLNKRGRDPFIHKYVWKGQLATGGSEQWKTYSRREKPFRPTAVTANVKFVRVFILPTWPPGIYYVDNVKLVEVTDK